MVLTEHRGFVWSVDGDQIVVALRQGGRVRCVNPEKKFDTGDRVIVIPDSTGKRIIEVMTEADAEHAVRCGIDPFYAAFCRELDELPQDEEEVLDDIECRESDDVYGIA